MTRRSSFADSPLATLIDYLYSAIESWLLVWRPVLITRRRLILKFLSAIDSLALFKVSMVVSRKNKRVWSQFTEADLWMKAC